MRMNNAIPAVTKSSILVFSMIVYFVVFDFSLLNNSLLLERVKLS
jgi:hypothetical protein